MNPSEAPRHKVVGTVVCLPARDLDTSVAFYKQVFDLPELAAEGGIIVVELPNLSLFLIEEKEFESYSRKAGRGAQYPDADVSVILSCAIATREALDEMLDSVPRHGGRVVKQATMDEEMGLYLGYFFDPDGHHWEIAFSGSGTQAKRLRLR